MCVKMCSIGSLLASASASDGVVSEKATREDCVRQLFVMDPLDRIDPEGDSTYVLMLEAVGRGWPVWCCTPDDLWVEGGRAHALASRVDVRSTAPHLQVQSTAEMALGDVDVVWMRKDPPFDMTYIFSTYMLDLVPPETLVLNNPAALRNFNEKMCALRWAALGPTTLVSRRIDQLWAFAAAAPGRIVIKPWDGNGGRGVLITEEGDPNLRSMLEVLTEGERTWIVAQHHIDEITEGDKRIILIDGEPVGGITRIPQPGDHRGNMHVGARVESIELTARDKEICEAIGPTLKESGLLFVGIDIIGRYLTEINVTSPTGIREINAFTGACLEADLTDAVVARLALHRSS